MTRILISMPDEFLANIDKIANDEYRTRSELIRVALKHYIAKQGITNPIKEKKNGSNWRHFIQNYWYNVCW